MKNGQKGSHIFLINIGFSCIFVLAINAFFCFEREVLTKSASALTLAPWFKKLGELVICFVEIIGGNAVYHWRWQQTLIFVFFSIEEQILIGYWKIFDKNESNYLFTASIINQFLECNHGHTIAKSFEVGNTTGWTKKRNTQNSDICKQATENLSLSLSIILSLRNQIFNKEWSEPSEKV